MTPYQAVPGLSPRLDDAELGVLHDYGTESQVEEGTVLFSPADDHYDLFVVLDGAVSLSVDGASAPQTLATFGSREFLGGLDALAGRRTAATARMAVSGRVLRIPAARAQANGRGARVERAAAARFSAAEGFVHRARYRADLDWLPFPG